MPSLMRLLTSQFTKRSELAQTLERTTGFEPATLTLARCQGQGQDQLK